MHESRAPARKRSRATLAAVSDPSAPGRLRGWVLERLRTRARARARARRATAGAEPCDLFCGRTWLRARVRSSVIVVGRRSSVSPLVLLSPLILRVG